MGTPTSDGPPRDRRTTDQTIEELTAQVEDLKKIQASDPQAVRALIEATQGLGAQVANLSGALQTVNDLQDESVRLKRQQTELEAKVLPKKTFDELWEQNAGRLVHIGKVNRRIGLSAFLAAVILTGSLLAYVVHHQAGVNSSQATLNAQRTASCVEKNKAAQETIDFFGPLLAQEKAEANPDPVLIKALTGIVLGSRLQIVACPGTASTPNATPSATTSAGLF